MTSTQTKFLLRCEKLYGNLGEDTTKPPDFLD